MNIMISLKPLKLTYLVEPATQITRPIKTTHVNFLSFWQSMNNGNKLLEKYLTKITLLLQLKPINNGINLPKKGRKN